MTAVEALLPGGAARPLLEFALGYLAVNVVPGPSMLAVAGQAALRGWRGALPLVLGIAFGAAALAAALQLAFQVFADLPELERAGRAVGGLLLLLVAFRALVAPRLPYGGGMPSATPGAAWLGFLAGFATAAGNPITGAYFLAQFLGPVAGAGAGQEAVALVLAQALLWSLLVASLFAQPRIRRVALAHHRLVCVASAGALAMLAAAMLGPMLE